MIKIDPDTIIVIAGATATGKTSAAVNLAEIISGEIISADSMQVYKYMDIGTAKPTRSEMRGIPHFMIDEVFPDEEFNVAAYKEKASVYLQNVRERGKMPIIAGGTGFYINALIKDTDFTQGAANLEIRRRYEELVMQRGNRYVYGILEKKDKASSARIHPNNIKRVIRALEYLEITGTSIADHNANEKVKILSDNIYFFVLNMDRHKLYEKINLRVDMMIENGLLREVQSLLNMGFGGKLVSMQGIGYKEVIGHINGEYGLDEAIRKIKQGSRNYAKRQVTWFKHQASGVIVDAEDVAYAPEMLISLIKNEIERRRYANR